MSISKYIGIPYGDHGRSHEALDCWGLLWLIYKEQLDIGLPSYADRYASAEDQEDITCLIHKEKGPWSQVNVDQVDFGDAALFRIKGEPWHIGVVISRGLMIHVMKDVNVCLERYDRSMWRHRLIGIYRHKALI
jgi:cell wall-associated NlpC family hydrolase